MRLFFPFLILFILGCSEINSGWEVDGGGFIKYQINNLSSREIELDEDDVRLPNINGHYMSLETREENSSHGDRLAFMVLNPQLGKNSVVANYTWFIYEYAPKASVISDSSFVTIDQRDDSTWTGNFKLYFQNCKTGTCLLENPIRVTGRFRYWLVD